MTMITCEDLLLSFVEIARVPAIYADLQAEIAAVRNDDKKLSRFLCDLDDLSMPELGNLLRECAAAGLLLTFSHVPGQSDEVFANVCREHEIWRIKACDALFAAKWQGFDWSDMMEVFQSTLLGYSSEEISSWMDSRRTREVGWQGTTVYLLMPIEYHVSLQKYGYRCVSPDVTSDVYAIVTRDDLILRPDTQTLIDCGIVLCRVAISSMAFTGVFGTFSYGEEMIKHVVVDCERAIVLNSGILSEIQTFREGAWSAHYEQSE